MTSALHAGTVAAIQDLELAARLIVEGSRAGGHRSPFHGFSAEFQQHRAYRVGDDLRHLDWKVLARTDRLYSKQFRETTSMSVLIVLDASGSMAYPPQGISKFRYASLIAASLAYVISTQGDAVGLLIAAESSGVSARPISRSPALPITYLPPRGGRLHLRAILAAIDRQSATGAADLARVITRGGELLKRRGVMLVISDFYDAGEPAQRALRRAARRGHDAGMIQVVSGDEVAFPFRGAVEFEDLESAERRTADADVIAEDYRDRIATFLAGTRAAAQRDGVDYTLMRADDAPERALREFLLRRAER